MLRWLYFTLACTATAWGLAGWASHFLIPAHVLYVISLSAGIVFGLIVTLIPWGRSLGKIALFALWPLGVTTIFFNTTGTFDFADVSYVGLLNFEFALTWGGILWAVIVFWPRKMPVFAPRKPGAIPYWQIRPDEQFAEPAYFLPDKMDDLASHKLPANERFFDDEPASDAISIGDEKEKEWHQ